VPTRVLVFVDYMNCYRRAREAFTPGSRNHVDGQVDPLRLAEFLCGPGRQLVGLRVYRGLPSNERNPKAYAAARSQIAAWTGKERVTAVTRPLNYRTPATPREKGIDVRIAVDMVLMGMLRQYDVAVLVSEDTDLLPAVEAVIAMKGERAVEVMAWVPITGGRALPLWIKGRTLAAHRLGEKEYRLAHDGTDYTKVFDATSDRT
jgi:hypothetical protein